MSDILKKQIDGTHYKDMGIQPWEIIEKNKLDYFEGAALKYLLRWRVKDGVIDLDKIIHYVERIKELAQKGHYGERFYSITKGDVFEHNNSKYCQCDKKFREGQWIIFNPENNGVGLTVGEDMQSTPYKYCPWCGFKINKD